MAVSRLWLLVTLPALVGAVVLVVRLATGIVKLSREAIVAALPVVERQRIVLPTSDRYSILVQGSLGERGLGDLRFSVVGDRDGTQVNVSPVYVRGSGTSLDGNVRLELFSFSAAGGPHTLQTLGLDPARDYTRNRVIIARRSRGGLVLRVVGLIFAGLTALGSIVATSLIIASRR
jgi:hypothetical protein